ncbi:MAG TPA: hypothetical protein VHX16_08150 [Chloroflexota bacterium]|jgi:hypothetical protein|nr:hypothetical protein [Chloroflexota bacterium]
MSESTENTSAQASVMERPRAADLAKLHFLRWLAEQGRLEHEVFGPSSGKYKVALKPDAQI